ncbi:MAG: hypothetical protein RL264_766 [Bacteroidota bacterium]|jgi:hypothetical protein
MLNFKFLIFFSIVCLSISSCTKDKTPIPPQPQEEPWEKFVGNYKVYDTSGVYLFDSEIEHYSGKNIYGLYNDSLRIKNFMNKMDYEFIFIPDVNPLLLDLKIQDSIVDYSNHHWFLYRIYDDTNTSIHENCLIDGKLTLYFNITNIKFYINESVPYVNETIKHVYVKQ